MRPLAKDGRLLAILVFMKDLTDLKLPEPQLNQRLDQLVETTSLHRAMVASALDCIFLMDAEGTVFEFNPAAEATFGFSRDEAIGKSIVDLIVPPDVRDSGRSRREVFRYLMDRDAIGQAMKRNAVTKDGRAIAIELTITLVASKDREMFMAHCRTSPRRSKSAAAWRRAKRRGWPPSRSTRRSSRARSTASSWSIITG